LPVNHRTLIVLVAAATTLLAAAPAEAAFPGANGKLAFTSDRNGTKDVWTLNADGSGQTMIQSDGTEDFYDPYPAWSPNGQDIAYMHDYRPFNHQGNVFVMDAAGGNQRQVTSAFEYDNSPTWAPDGARIAYSTGGVLMVTQFPSNGSPQTLATPADSYDWDPDWSPDGTLVAFTNFTGICGGHGGGCVQWANIQVVDPSNGQIRSLTTGQNVLDLDPSISPDGSTVVFASDRAGSGRRDLYTVPITGGTPTLLTDTPTLAEEEPVWSPDGRKIAFAGQATAGAPFDVYTINADGTDLHLLTVAPGDDHQPSWQPIPQSYVHPRGASPSVIFLVPAFAQCTSPNRSHGSPLSYGSCARPVQTSSQLTVGTPDANGQPAKSIAKVVYAARPGDVTIAATISDVRKSDLSDYTGELLLVSDVRITDKNNTPNPGGPGPGTVQDEPLPVTVACSATADTTVGSSCNVSTTVNALHPGAITAGQRSIWQLGQVRAFDGGADGNAQTTEDNTLFLDQGVFVP
jgi:Tol biopolymer transport system component